MNLYPILSWAKMMIEDKELGGDGDMGLPVTEKEEPWTGALWSPLTPRRLMILKLEIRVKLVLNNS